MNLPISVSRTSLFQILGVLVGIFHFDSNSNRTICKHTVETLIRCHVSVASDLGFHSLPVSHKKDARLIWVNQKGAVAKHRLIRVYTVYITSIIVERTTIIEL